MRLLVAQVEHDQLAVHLGHARDLLAEQRVLGEEQVDALVHVGQGQDLARCVRSRQQSISIIISW